MKWKTSTIVSILVISIGIIGFTQYEKRNTIGTLESEMEATIEERVNLEKEELLKNFETRIKNCEEHNQTLEEQIEEIKEKVRFIRNGGENEYYINQIKSNSKKTIEKLKIRKGEVFKHKNSGVVIFIRRDNFEEQISLNLTLPNKETEERYWETGKYYYYWNAQKNGLSQILPTYIGDKNVEVEWIYFKANEDFNISSNN